MAIPIMCRTCKDIVGVEPIVESLARSSAGIPTFPIDLDCPGRGNHSEAKRTEQSRLYGLIRQVTKEYPETNTTSSWVEYTGPPSKSLLCLAIIVAQWAVSDTSAGILVNGKHAWWSRKQGLYGDGVGALISSEQQSA